MQLEAGCWCCWEQGADPTGAAGVVGWVLVLLHPLLRIFPAAAYGILVKFLPLGEFCVLQIPNPAVLPALLMPLGPGVWDSHPSKSQHPASASQEEVMDSIFLP